MIKDVHEQVESSMDGKRYYVFGPLQARSLRHQYPELKTVDALDALPDDDMLFCWWYANRTSPIADLPDKERAKAAIAIAYKRDITKVQARTAQWEGLDFGHGVSMAIKAMASFDPGGRITAMVDDLHMLKQFQSVMRKDVTGATLDEFTEWAKAVREARKSRDEIIQRIEQGGYGVTEVSVGADPLEEVAAEFIINFSD